MKPDWKDVALALQGLLCFLVGGVVFWTAPGSDLWQRVGMGMFGMIATVATLMILWVLAMCLWTIFQAIRWWK